jgi:hypothetical protein
MNMIINNLNFIRMRKKSFLGFFLVAIAIFGTGCSNDEAVDIGNPQAISFRTQGGMPALRATGTTISNVDAFVVYGTDNVFAGKTPSELIFDGVTVARQIGAGDVFKYSPLRYYGENATNAGFFAYSPVSKYVTAPATADFLTNGASFYYTVPAPDATNGTTTQEDFLVAGEVVSGSALDPTSPSTTTNTVSLIFKHALARIFVTAQNTTADANVTIKELTLRNLYGSGDLEVDENMVWSWTPNDASKRDYSYALAATGISVPVNALPLFVTSKEQGMMVIPQELPWDNAAPAVATDFALEVKYDLANLKNQTKYIYLEKDYEFKAGKQYKININFTGTAIDFTITVGDWAPIDEVNYPPVVP